MNVLDIMRQINAFKQQASSLNLSENEEKQYIDQMTQSVMTGVEFDESALLNKFGEQRLSAQEEASDVQANAAPSLPSISNVGSVAPTGVVNWNAIPGGFQPLPQTTGSRKKLYQLSQFHGGINQKSSPRDIADFECQEATNVTVSSIGRIKLLGDMNSSQLGTFADGSALVAKGSGGGDTLSGAQPNAGYGYFIFKSGYSLASTPAVGERTILVAQDADYVQTYDGNNKHVGPDISSADTHVAPVYYAAGNGLYACDANFAHTLVRQCKVLVHRDDINGAVAVAGWVNGDHVLVSPTYNSSGDGAMATGTVKCTNDGGTSSQSGTVIAMCDPAGTAGTAGTWKGTYYFYISWLFDGGCETGLTSFADDGGDGQASNGILFANERLDFNINLMHTNAAPLGANKRINGARIYFKESGTSERWLLAEVSLIDGVKGALDSTFQPWNDTGGSAPYNLSNNIIFENPPEVYSYASLNGYYANEVYTKSADSNASTTAGPVQIDVRYKTAVVGQNGIVYIGNVRWDGADGTTFQDGMMFSMPGKPGVFPKFNMFDSPSSDGSPITALAAFQDKILQFKENAMYAINVSNPAQFYAEASFRDCGVINPCQVFTTSFGVIFANKLGCFIYDGSKVISLTSGKFTTANWGITENHSSIGSDSASVPSVGYDPRSQSIIVLKNIGHDNAASDADQAWIYNMTTQSWTESNNFINNAAGDVISNFQITPNGYLSFIQYDASDPVENPYTYNYGVASSNAQRVVYQTKDFDFGLPSQTKKLFKVYVTYKGNPSNLTVTWRVNGTATNWGFTATNWDDAGTTDYEIATFVPDSADEAAGVTTPWQSMSLRFDSSTNTVATDFEIQDISILYRVRPIK